MQRQRLVCVLRRPGLANPWRLLVLARACLRPAVVAALVALAPGTAWGAAISVGSTIPDPVDPTSPFLVEIRITGGVDVMAWNFDLEYDPAVVRVNDPPELDLFSYTTEGDFFAAGAPFNLLLPGAIELDALTFDQAGRLSGVQGQYQGLLAPPSGDGVLAYVEFRFVPGAEDGDPGFGLTNETAISVPEPAVLALLAGGLAARLHRRRGSRRSSGPRRGRCVGVCEARTRVCRSPAKHEDIRRRAR